MPLKVVILAAGQGTRMQSSLPKVLHEMAGKPLLAHVIATAKALKPKKIIIVHGHQGDLVKKQFPDPTLTWVSQTKQLGTGHAVMQALPEMSEKDKVLILSGDVPLISEATLSKLIKTTPNDAVGLVVAHFADPSGLGRIVRDSKDEIATIVEERDASDAEKQIKEINAGIMLVAARDLKDWLPQLSNHNSQKEYYLPQIIPMAVKAQRHITSITATCQNEVQGVNNRLELIRLERYYQQRLAEAFLLSGVTIKDPQHFYVRGDAQIAEDVTIDVNVILESDVIIGRHTQIEANCVLRNVTIGDNVHIKANSVIENAIIKNHCEVGPFARIRPETILEDHVKIGNFVELKKSHIKSHSKIPHLSYVGDAQIGSKVNVGAGTITCNYDGANKHPTIIEDDVFIGSDTQLIAPVRIKRGSTIAAGTTVTKDTLENTLTLSRVEQTSIANWKRPRKQAAKKNKHNGD